jgi:hypothetical protein
VSAESGYPCEQRIKSATQSPIDLPHSRSYKIKTTPKFVALKECLVEEIRAEALKVAAMRDNGHRGIIVVRRRNSYDWLRGVRSPPTRALFVIIVE